MVGRGCPVLSLTSRLTIGTVLLGNIGILPAGALSCPEPGSDVLPAERRPNGSDRVPCRSRSSSARGSGPTGPILATFVATAIFAVGLRLSPAPARPADARLGGRPPGAEVRPSRHPDAPDRGNAQVRGPVDPPALHLARRRWGSTPSASRWARRLSTWSATESTGPSCRSSTPPATQESEQRSKAMLARVATYNVVVLAGLGLATVLFGSGSDRAARVGQIPGRGLGPAGDRRGGLRSSTLVHPHQGHLSPRKDRAPAAHRRRRRRRQRGDERALDPAPSG